MLCASFSKQTLNGTMLRSNALKEPFETVVNCVDQVADTAVKDVEDVAHEVEDVVNKVTDGVEKDMVISSLTSTSTTTPTTTSTNAALKPYLLIDTPHETDIHSEEEVEEHADVTETSIELGYSYMPESHWEVPQRRPPVCIPSSDPFVTPVYTHGVPSNAVEWVPKKKRNGCKKTKHERRDDMALYYPGYVAKPVQSGGMYV